MKIEQHEIFSHFEFSSDRWQVKLELDYSHQRPQLIVEVVDTLSARVNAARWSVERLASSPEMKLIFPTLEELFYYLAHNSNSLQISERAIQFKVNLGEAMKRSFSFAIELNGKEMSKQDVNELRIKLLETRFQKQMKIKDEQIKNLQRQLQIILNRLGSKQQMAVSSENKSIKPHPYNPDNTCFNYSNGANGLRVKRVLANNWVNFIAETPIVRNVAVFRIKVWKLSNRCLCLGVGTSNMFGVHNYHEVEFLNYDFELKQIAVDGRKINAPSNVSNGSILTVRCDPKIQKLWWYCDQKEIGSALFPQQIKNQELFLIAYFKNANDELQIWQE